MLYPWTKLLELEIQLRICRVIDSDSANFVLEINYKGGTLIIYLMSWSTSVDVLLLDKIKTTQVWECVKIFDSIL